MERRLHIRSGAGPSLLTLSLVTVPAAFAQGPNELDEVQVSKAQAAAMAVETANYWTPERMADAKPMTAVFDEADPQTYGDGLDERQVASEGEEVLPGYAPGWKPGRRRQPEADETHTITRDDPLWGIATGETAEGAQPQHGSKPSNPRTGPYGPFQRWRDFTSRTGYPTSTLGKLFFTLNGINYVCSASVIHRNTLITAGHCNSDGNGTFATNRLFCPSYNKGEHPTRGCWPVVASKTSFNWHNNGDPDYDYACLITSTTGTKVNNSIGNVTGWLGRAWNWSPSQAVRTFGYPAAAPFDGNRLTTTASTEWYIHDFRSGGQVSKIIGSDLTGGSSGGSWILGWQRGGEPSDSDGNSVTDPGSNWVNGVNSHKRCRTTCQSPPTTTNGVFWQEMSSPPFRNSSAGDESEDIVNVCFNNSGT
jgi:V8-like Glu-specific endopeptidase